MYQLQFTSQSAHFVFMYDNQSIMFTSEENTYEVDSAWMKISKEMRNAYNISNKMNSMTKQFHIHEILSATLLINGNVIAKYDPSLNFSGEDALIYNESNHMSNVDMLTAVLFVRFKDVALSAKGFFIDIEKGLRIITTFDELDKLNFDQALLDQ
jgi:hypothetical protein